MIKCSLLSSLCAVTVALAGCGSSSGGGSTGGGGASASGGAGGASATDYVTMPSATGFVDHTENMFGIQGAWYPYGDQYGPPPGGAKCTNIGKHMGGTTAPPAECSIIDRPDAVTPNAPFNNTGGMMCTSGTAAQILPCTAGLVSSGCPTFDYSNMWGAGIGFNLNQDKMEDGGAKHTWNPDTYGVKGIAFDIDMVPLTKLRIEFAMQLPAGTVAADGTTPILTTDDHPDGAPYWGASSAFPPSPVVPGHNVIHWAEVKSPYQTMGAPAATHYNFDRTQILAVQFHALPAKTARGAYSFCIHNLTLLTE